MQTKDISSGSLKEVWRITFPLMIAALSMFAMFFVDRLFLANYSTQALNAAASAGTLTWSFILFWTTLAMMAEVFVAQYNGAKKYEKLGEPVWQMIWLTVLSVFVFIPMGIWGAPKIYPTAEFAAHAELFRWVMFIGPFFVLQSSLTAFFVGQGKTSIVRWLSIAGNLINVALDPLFIFGWKWFPSMGVKGACIATGIGVLFQCAIFAFAFLKRDNRENFGASSWRFSKPLFYSCIRVGLPPALATGLEVFGWSVFYWMMTKVGDIHIITTSIVQSVIMLFLFFAYGLEKGASTIAGNLIGAKQTDRMPHLIRSSTIMIGVFAGALCATIALFPDFILDLFLKNSQLIADGASATAIEVRSFAKIGLFVAIAYLVLEAARWLFAGILTAAGDTLFLMIANAASIWLFVLVPTYMLVVRPKASVAIAFWIWIGYGILSFGLLWLRYKQGKWKERNLIEEAEQEETVTQEAISAPPEES